MQGQGETLIPFQMCRDPRLPALAYHVIRPRQQSQKSDSISDLDFHLQPKGNR